MRNFLNKTPLLLLLEKYFFKILEYVFLIAMLHILLPNRMNKACLSSNNTNNNSFLFKLFHKCPFWAFLVVYIQFL